MNAPARAHAGMADAVVEVDFRHASESAFKAGMRRMAQPVAVATLARAGERAGMTISSFCSLSADPPRMMACISHSASAHPLLQPGAAMAINVLAEGQDGLGMRFSSASVKGEARFEGGCWAKGVGGAPVLADALTVFDGRVRDVFDAGSHSIVTLDVIAVGGGGGGSLLYADGGFVALAREARNA